MKKILSALLLIFGCSVLAHAAAIPITGTIRLPNGNAMNGRVRFTLSVSSARDTSASNLIVAQIVEFPVQNGSVPTTAKIVPNDVLSPANTTYSAQYFSPAGFLMGQNVFYISGTQFNIGAATPTPLTTSNISFNNLTGLDNVDTGELNNRQMCDQKTGSTAGAKIQACADALPATGGTADATGLQGAAQTITSTITLNKAGTHLVLGAATYTMSAAINVTANNVTIECGQETILKRATGFDNTNLIVGSSSSTPTSGFTLKNCYIDGNKPNTTAQNSSMVIAVAASNCNILNNRIINAPGQSIGIGGVETGSVKNPSSSCTIEDNFISGSNDHSLDVNGSHDMVVKHNQAYSGQKTCFFFGHGDTLRHHVEGNTAGNCGASPNTSDGDGFLFFNGPLFAESVTNYGHSVKDNIAYGNYGAGIKWDSVLNSVVTGNILYNNNQQADHATLWSGISIDTQGGGPPAPSGNIFSNNRAFDNQGTKTQDCGIRENTGTDNIFTGNQLDGNRTCTLLTNGTQSRTTSYESDGAGLVWDRFQSASNGTQKGRVSFFDENFYIDFNRISSSNPTICFANNACLIYDRSTTAYSLTVAGNNVASFKHAGSLQDQLFVGPSSNNFYFDAGASGAVPTMVFDNTDTLTYDRTNNRWQWNIGGAEKFRLDTSGVTISSLTSTGAASGKKVVCVDTATGLLYASSTGTDCSN